ncbi:MAG: XRE family transcriptional regulator [Deltaproteobacteria bacterium]|jgi:Zn-dependent peptidase ImmA (M78 family)/transcriptional regulator with XRE-family HTH domain|nr:XRE family transcriptional regulator [Deltaproteobacteria bacterium]
MSLRILAKNVRRLRTAKRLSQSALADEAGLSLPAIRSLELAKQDPQSRTIQAIAKALDVKLHELFQPVRELRTVRFRSAKRLRTRENVLAEVARWLDDFNFLEECLSNKIQFRLDEVCGQYSRDRLVSLALLCRKKLGLNDKEPIYDIRGLIEHAGVKLFTVSVATDGFFGLSVGKEDGGPAVVVNEWERISVERRIFSAARELGHLLAHPESFDVAEDGEIKVEEKEADCFAGHFLMPNDGFRKEWEKASGLGFVDRVFKIKRIFRVSYKTVLSRLLEEGAVDNSIWMKFNIAYQRRFNRKLSFKEDPMRLDSVEPFGMRQFDFYEDRFKRLTREAVEKDKISLSRGAEMLRIGIEEMQELFQNWEVVT